MSQAPGREWLESSCVCRVVHRPCREAVIGPPFTAGCKEATETNVRLVYEPPCTKANGERLMSRCYSEINLHVTWHTKESLPLLIDYVLNRSDAFVRYTSDGRIPIDNNVIERLLRPVAIGRKNYLFFGSEKGGKTAPTLYTLVQSARRNCVDVWPYLTEVLRRISAIAPDDTTALEAPLPDRWVAVHPEHRLEQREEESREAPSRRRRKRLSRRAAIAP